MAIINNIITVMRSDECAAGAAMSAHGALRGRAEELLVTSPAADS